MLTNIGLLQDRLDGGATVAGGDETGCWPVTAPTRPPTRDYRDRYRALATSLGFKGHMKWAEAAMTCSRW